MPIGDIKDGAICIVIPAHGMIDINIKIDGHSNSNRVKSTIFRFDELYGNCYILTGRHNDRVCFEGWD